VSGSACTFGIITGECRLGFRRIAHPLRCRSREAAYLRDLRLSIGIGLRDAHQRLGISPASYSELERGHFECDWDTAYVLLAAQRSP
jgi:hypothetical protein